MTWKPNMGLSYRHHISNYIETGTNNVHVHANTQTREKEKQVRSFGNVSTIGRAWLPR